MIRSFTLRRRSLLLLIPAVLFAFLLLDASSASSQTLAINCSVTILPKIGAVRVRSLRTVDDNSWMMVISLNDDGTMVVSTAKTYDPNIWAEGTVVSSIRATQVTADSAGYRWLKVTLLDDKGNQFNLPAYIVEKSKTAVYVKLDCQNATAASGGGSAPTAPPPTAVVPNANPPTATPLTVSLVTVTLTPTPPQPAATSAGTLPTVALSQIFYVSCLRNGAGPGINLLPVSITLASNGKTLSIPVGTYVVRTVDDTGAPLPPDARGRVQVTWGDAQWFIAQDVIRQPGADGSTNCDGRITPMPTVTPYVSPTPTATIDPAQSVPVTTGSTDFGDPDFGTLAYNVVSPFGPFRPAIVTTAGIFGDGAVNILPDPIATCVATASQADIAAGKCDPGTPDKLLITSPVAGCLYHQADTTQVIIVVSRSGIGCKDAVIYPRLEIILTHLDPASITGIKTLAQSVKPGDGIGLFCAPSVTLKSFSPCGSSLPYVALQFRVNKTYNTSRVASKQQLLTLLPALRQ